MTSALPDPATEFGARVARRLRDEQVAWLTPVDRSGTPQPAPVWFLWDGRSALIYSDKRAKRLAHLERNPRAALSLNSTDTGGDVVVLTGEVTVDPASPAPPDNAEFLAKYGRQITDDLQMTPDGFAETYSVALRFTPSRVRGF